MGGYKPVVGDRVRVVIEGEVTITNSGSDPIEFRVGTTDGSFGWINKGDEDTSVEKVEPPVVTFKPGDVVRSKTFPEWYYAIADHGYVELPDGNYRKHPDTASAFDARGYELVSLG